MNRREAESHESPPAPAVADAFEPVPAPAPQTAKRPVLSATAEEWRSWMVERGYPAYRARQVLDWVIRRRAESFERMSDLPKPLRHRLDAEWTVFGTRAAYHDVAPDGTDKLVVELLQHRADPGDPEFLGEADPRRGRRLARVRAHG